MKVDRLVAARGIKFLVIRIVLSRYLLSQKGVGDNFPAINGDKIIRIHVYYTKTCTYLATKHSSGYVRRTVKVKKMRETVMRLSEKLREREEINA